MIEHWRQYFPSFASYVEADALEYLTRTNFIGDEVVYCDPPYDNHGPYQRVSFRQKIKFGLVTAIVMRPSLTTRLVEVY